MASRIQTQLVNDFHSDLTYKNGQKNGKKNRNKGNVTESRYLSVKMTKSRPRVSLFPLFEYFGLLGVEVQNSVACVSLPHLRFCDLVSGQTNFGEAAASQMSIKLVQSNRRVSVRVARKSQRRRTHHGGARSFRRTRKAARSRFVSIAQRLHAGHSVKRVCVLRRASVCRKLKLKGERENEGGERATAESGLGASVPPPARWL